MRDIKKNHTKLAGISIFFLLQSGAVVAAEDDFFRGSLAASELWDDNFFRARNGFEQSEQISLLTANLGVATKISRQRLSASWRVRTYQHAENDHLNETFQDGVANWNGAWAGDFTSNLEWSRSSYLVDKWEAPASDVVSKDVGKFVLTKGRDNRFSFQVGVSQSNQEHSNEQYTNINYEEREGYAGITYQTPSRSILTLRYRNGDRTYEELGGLNPYSQFDFDFDQVEVENTWRMSQKTNSTFTFARFKRKGIVTDSTGDFALLDFSWDATPKIQFHGGYSYTKPALGDTVDRPTTIQAGFASFSWDITTKLNFLSRIEKFHRDYSNPDEEFPRTESQYNVIPVSLTYIMNESLSFKVDAAWRKNESPLLEKEYEATQVTAGTTFRF